MQQGAPRGKRKEDYIRAIYDLQRSRGSVRVKDVSEVLGVSMPTALEELRRLSHEGLVSYDRGSVSLTSEAISMAESLERKREILVEFLEVVLGADREEAERIACYMEHLVGDDLVERARRLAELAAECGWFSGILERAREGRATCEDH